MNTVLKSPVGDKVTKWRCGWINWTSVYLTPYVRIGAHFAFAGWLKFEVGFWRENKR